MILYTDFETRSTQEIKGKYSVGLWNYFTHESTRWLMLGYAFDNGPIHLWFPKDPMPNDLKAALDDPSVQIVAFNSAFERYCFKFLLGRDIPIDRFQDPQASGRILSLPQSLEDQGVVLNLPVEMRKDKRGEELMQKFSKPSKKRKKRGQEAETFFYEPEDLPEDWIAYGDYCIGDNVAEREVGRRENLLGVFPLNLREREIWILDQVINDRGLPTDRDFATKGLRLAAKDQKDQLEELDRQTGLENSNSRDQMLEWIKTQGFTENNLRKGTVESFLKYSKEKLTPLGLKVLEARQEASSTSYKKMSAILRQINNDDRLRGQFIYAGSPACGRWAGSGFQFHNQARPLEIFEDVKNLELARKLIYAEDQQGIKDQGWSVLLTVKSCIRTSFRAKEGKRLNISDLNAIETRVGAWVAGCNDLLEGFKNIKDFDPYMAFAMKLTQIPYETLIKNKKSKDPIIKAEAKRYRQFGKIGVLGAIYRLGGGDWGWRVNKDKTKDKIRTGLWGFAESYGIELTKEESHNIVKVFRNAYREIPQCWYALEEAVEEVLAGVKTIRYIGPDDCIKIDKINLANSHPILRIQLPSGRHLHYFSARIEPCKMPWKGKDEEGNEIDVMKDALVYARQNQKTKQWDNWITSHGGKLFENIVQGIARDVLADCMVLIEKAGMPVVGHVHDEIITETDDTPFTPDFHDMEMIMSQPISWAPGLPLAAEGFSSEYYRKG